MTKLLKFSRRTIGILLEWTLALVILLAFAVRTSSFQTYLAQKATNYLSKELKTSISISSVDIMFFNKVTLGDILVLDLNKDTLLIAERINITIDNIQIPQQIIKFGSIEIENTHCHIQKSKDSVYNFKFISNYFKSPKKKNKTSLSIHSNELIFSDVHFQYDDFTRDYLAFGVDYWHLNAKKINGLLNDVSFENEIVSSQIASFSLEEDSGFILKNLITKAKFSKNGIELENVVINTNESTIYSSEFNMISNQFTDFRKFVDSVSFDAIIDSSTVNISDVAYFAPILEGMVDVIHLKTRLDSNVTHLNFEDLHLTLKGKTQINGDFKLNDYRNIQNDYFKERIDYIYIDLDDLATLRLPNSASSNYIQLNETVKSLQFFEASNIQFSGNFSHFKFSSNHIKTELGKIQLEKGLLFNKTNNDSYLFSSNTKDHIYIGLSDFNLGKLINNTAFETADAKLILGGEISTKGIDLTEIEGEIQKIVYSNYPYSNISIKNGSYINGLFKSQLIINDPNLKMTFDGEIETIGETKMNFNIDIAKANLDTLNLGRKNSALTSKIDINLSGPNFNKLGGELTINDLSYREENNSLDIPVATLVIRRSDTLDHYQFNSNLLDASIEGQFNPSNIEANINLQLSRLFPNLFHLDKLAIQDEHSNHFSFEITSNELDPFLDIFVPDLHIAQQTTLKGEYFDHHRDFQLNLLSENITYKDKRFEGIDIHQVLDSINVFGEFHIDNFAYNDSLQFQHVHFNTEGQSGKHTQIIEWGYDSTHISEIKWQTQIDDWQHFKFDLQPSEFYLTDNKWKIPQVSSISVMQDTITIDNFELRHDDQVLFADGKVSNSNANHLNYKINNFDLNEINFLNSEKYQIEGILDGWGFISNPVNDFKYIADAKLEKLKINGHNVGDIFVQSEWDEKTKSIVANGDLIYKENQTFDFSGNYYIEKEKDNIDFKLNFDYTDIQFVNAFLDPDVLSDIRGLLKGKIELKGELLSPKITGDIDLTGGSVFLTFLGVHFGMYGPIQVVQDAFYIDNMPLFDENGNAGSLVGTIIHNGFTDFNFDVQVDIERDVVNKDPFDPYKIVPLEEFLVMKTDYDPDVIYYGEAYATGTTNISGTTDDIEITVDLTTKKGTKVNIPMYGFAEIDDESDFIVFKSQLTDTIIQEAKKLFDFTGVNLDLSFDVTRDAELKIIFNEDNGDEITTHGDGKINIQLDDIGNVAMTGLFTVHDGTYNFVLGPLKQPFTIEQGGTLTWLGDPLDAILNIRTYYKVKANIADISQDQLSSGKSVHQPIFCYLNLEKSILRPTLSFDIEAPEADAIDRSLISRVKSDPDELNRQFFSLLLWKRFQPLAGSIYNDGSATLDLVSNQINSMLSNVSKNIDLNVQLDSDQLSGNDQYQFGLSKGFLDDRLIISGSFGVENYSSQNKNQSDWIGDLYLEYLINENGSFRVDIFNESTEQTIIESNGSGAFTQGVGLSYKEDFNTLEDLKALQHFLNLFRKKENRVHKKRKNREYRLTPETTLKED